MARRRGARRGRPPAGIVWALEESTMRIALAGFVVLMGWMISTAAIAGDQEVAAGRGFSAGFADRRAGLG
ncbi:MAG: hypothetical protein CL933_12175 [Deltaproteobacteria bacterium]|nr:hypothetical protein [Deltaproteobacteria bacterium]